MFKTDFDCYIFCECLAVASVIFGLLALLSRSQKGNGDYIYWCILSYGLFLFAIGLQLYAAFGLPAKLTLYRGSMEYYQEKENLPGCIKVNTGIANLDAHCLYEYATFRRDSANAADRYYNYIESKKGN